MARQLIKLFFACLLFILNSQLARGQTNLSTNSKSPKNHWSVDLLSGVQANYFTDEQPHHFITGGFNTTVQATRWFGNRWGISALAGYAGNGGGLVSFYDQTWLGFDPSITFKNVKQSTWVLHSLEQGIALNYKIRAKAGWGLELYGAPLLAINLAEWEKYEKTGDLLPQNGSAGVIATITNRQYTDKFEPYWWSLRGGLRLSLPLKKHQFMIDAGFTNGITPANFSYSYINTAGIQGNIRTNSFKLAIGYRFGRH